MEDIKWLIAREIPYLRRYARALARDRDLADDLVQDTLEKALRKRRQWSRKGSVRAWLLTALYRTFLNDRRGRIRLNEQSIDTSAPGIETRERTTPGTQETRMILADTMDAVHALPEDQRVALLLVSLEDLSYEEAAGILDIPVGTLRSRIARAREALRAEPESGTEPAARIRRVK